MLQENKQTSYFYKAKTTVMKRHDSNSTRKLFQQFLLPQCVSFQMMFAHKQILYHCIPQVHLKGKSIFISVHFLLLKKSQMKQNASRQVLKSSKLNHSMFGNLVLELGGGRASSLHLLMHFAITVCKKLADQKHMFLQPEKSGFQLGTKRKSIQSSD